MLPEKNPRGVINIMLKSIKMVKNLLVLNILHQTTSLALSSERKRPESPSRSLLAGNKPVEVKKEATPKLLQGQRDLTKTMIL